MPLKSKYRNLPRFASGGAIPVPPDVPAPAPATTAEEAAASLKAQIEAMQGANTAMAAPQPRSTPKPAPQPQPDAEPRDGLDNVDLPPLAKQWLRAHPDYLTDIGKNNRLQDMHHKLVAEGFEGYSAPYFEEMEWRLRSPVDKPEFVEGANGTARIVEGVGPVSPAEYEHAKAKVRAREALEAEDEYDAKAPSRRVVSAPPSREVPSSGSGRYEAPNRITLSPAEREAAKIAGVDEATYALNKLKLLQAKSQGEYGGSP
jgi:hypothetical protein